MTFTATVTANSPGSGTPTGTVTFYDGTNVLGIGTLNSSGKATFTTSALAVGRHSITAVYGGNTNYTTSTSSALTQTVIQDPTTTTVSASQISVPPGTRGDIHSGGRGESPRFGHPDANGNLLRWIDGAGYGGPGQLRRCYVHRNLDDAGQAQDHRGLQRRYELRQQYFVGADRDSDVTNLGCTDAGEATQDLR